MKECPSLGDCISLVTDRFVEDRESNDASNLGHHAQHDHNQEKSAIKGDYFLHKASCFPPHNLRNIIPVYVDSLPHKTDGLAGSSHPAHQTGEEETEAEGDDGVAPEHVAIEEPVDRHGGGQHPGHVPDQDAANHLDEEQSVRMFVNS